MTVAAATKPQVQTISRDEKVEQKISDLESALTEKKELIALFEDEINVQQARVPEARQHFENIEQLYYMPKPRASEKQVSEASNALEQTVREVDVEIKKRKGAIIQAQEELTEIEKELKAAKKEYREQRISSLMASREADLHRQIDALNILLQVDDNERQRGREAQEIDFKFTLRPIYVDLDNRHHVEGFIIHSKGALGVK